MIWMRVDGNRCGQPGILTVPLSVLVLVENRQCRERTVESSFQRSLPWFASFAVCWGLEAITASEGETAWNLDDQHHVTQLTSISQIRYPTLRPPTRRSLRSAIFGSRLISTTTDLCLDGTTRKVGDGFCVGAVPSVWRVRVIVGVTVAYQFGTRGFRGIMVTILLMVGFSPITLVFTTAVLTRLPDQNCW